MISNNKNPKAHTGVIVSTNAQIRYRPRSIGNGYGRSSGYARNNSYVHPSAYTSGTYADGFSRALIAR